MLSLDLVDLRRDVVSLWSGPFFLHPGFQMKDEEFQLDSAESKNTLLTNMFTGTGLFISFLLSLSFFYHVIPPCHNVRLEVGDVEQLGA